MDEYMECFVTVDWMRAIATWQPITNMNKDAQPALSNLAIWSVDTNHVFAAVTDRYRIVYAETSGTGQTGFVDGTPMIVPMSLIVSFVNAHKNTGGREIVGLVVENGTMKVNCNGSTVAQPYPRNSYPRIDSLVKNPTPYSGEPNMRFNMKLMADVYKFANPNVPFTTAAKRDTSWLFECVGGSTGGTWRLTQGNADTFGVLIQATNKK